MVALLIHKLRTKNKVDMRHICPQSICLICSGLKQMSATTELPIPKHQEMKSHFFGVVWNESFKDWAV